MTSPDPEQHGSLHRCGRCGLPSPPRRERAVSFDYIVVGSGLAGLTFAALAANSGARVLVLEAHYHPGGYGHTFRFGKPPDEYRFNAQLHYVWNCGPGRTVHNVLSKLGLADSVTFQRLDPNGFDRMRIPGRALDIPNGYPELTRRLVALFPDHADALTAFISEVEGLAGELESLPPAPMVARMLPRLHRFRRVIRHRDHTLQQAFDAFGLPLEAQALLALQWPDFLLPPERLSFFAWVMLFAGYQRGAWYPTHHFEHVVDSLVEKVRERGELRLKHRVVEFLFEGDAVVGVIAEEVDDDAIPTGVRHELRAPTVICNMDPKRAAEMIGPARFSRPLKKKLDYRYSPSNFMAYLVVEGIDLREHGFGRSNLFHSELPDLNEAFRRMEAGDYRQPSFAMTVPSLLTEDRSDCPPGKQVVELLTVADYDRFLHLRIANPRAYRAKKVEIYDEICRVIERDYVPGFRERVCFKLLGSPTSNQRYCLSPVGNSYGSDMIPSQIGAGRLGADSSVAGLWFCNASSGFAGFSGTFWTGATLWERLGGDKVLTGPHIAAP